MSAEDRLAGIRKKLDRADEHLEALYAERDAFVKRKPQGVREQFDPKTGWFVAHFEVFEEPPLEWSVVLGEVAYHLRSALDHLVWQLVLVNGRKPGRWNQFPIFAVESDFVNVALESKKRRPWLDGVSDEGIALIKELQPYHRGARAKRDLLYILDWLSRTDKHRVL